MNRADLFSEAKCWVIKVGTRVCIDSNGRLNGPLLLSLAQQIAGLRQAGCQVVLVSSGAVGMGREILKLAVGAEHLPTKQALAAIGQVAMMDAYKDIFSLLNICVAQVLLTWDDLNARGRYLNARNTLMTLLEHQVIPIINENDSVATMEIRFGDNDCLAAMVGGLVNADVVVNLTSAPGIMLPPAEDGTESGIVDMVSEITPELEALDRGVTTQGGTGGLATKLQAAKNVLLYGGAMVIAPAREPNILWRIRAGEKLGTVFVSSSEHLPSRKRWLAGGARCTGKVFIDQGAVAALTQRGSSLLPVGVIAVEGDFCSGDLVSIVGTGGIEIGRGLVNYDSFDTRKLLGKNTEAVVALLGHAGYQDLVHRDNLVLTAPTENAEN